ncbi:hypothetical protein LOTGIDRAFT_164395 [Lottia gigantea]|uniref:BZIP domain-containing protein n=1 Tax=Lottia gigantea TaxID=225164 RepID=V4A9W5_LOTGI|nr:hypothetical protein LOTGIDRAFT_164395 [Lottia gigantea]ESO90091.1 hypothetical protein LOTGIDRAFT_164395 [Lottia gigantea]
MADESKGSKCPVSPENFFRDISEVQDPSLRRATYASLETGQLTPLLKEELKCRIQSRRLSEGKEELLVDFTSPSKFQPRPDEIEKLNKRREQNRRAARKFRQKKRKDGDNLMKESEKLESDNTSLQEEIAKLYEERKKLEEIWSDHTRKCQLITTGQSTSSTDVT